MKIAITEVPSFDPRGKRCTAGLLTALFLTAFSSNMAAHKTSYQPKNSFVTQIKCGEADVLQAVEGVTEDQIIHGTYSYEKERTLYGAHATGAAPVFGRWDDAGKAFYKVAREILAPRFFKDSGDIGTIWVRYVVEPVDHSQTNLRIDAVFVDARNVIHPSAGEVEAGEYQAIQDRLPAASAASVSTPENDPPGFDRAPSFHQTREEILVFPGKWEPLDGKKVKIIWIQPLNQKSFRTEPKLKLVKSVFQNSLNDASGATPPLAGVVVILDSEDGGMAATTMATLQQWHARHLPDGAFWKRCLLDPADAFKVPKLKLYWRTSTFGR